MTYAEENKTAVDCRLEVRSYKYPCPYYSGPPYRRYILFRNRQKPEVVSLGEL